MTYLIRATYMHSEAQWWTYYCRCIIFIFSSPTGCRRAHAWAPLGDYGWTWRQEGWESHRPTSGAWREHWFSISYTSGVVTAIHSQWQKGTVITVLINWWIVTDGSFIGQTSVQLTLRSLPVFEGAEWCKCWNVYSIKDPTSTSLHCCISLP